MSTVEGSLQRRYCLYLPGICIHCAPVSSGSVEELHFEDPDSSASFTYNHITETSEIHPAFRKLPLVHLDQQVSLSYHTAMIPHSEIPSMHLDLPTPGLTPDASPLTPGTPLPHSPCLQEFAELINYEKAFENTSTSVAASQMRNALNNLADTVKDPAEKKVWFELNCGKLAC